MDNTLSFLQSQNPDLPFYRVQDPAFVKYGQIYNDIQVASLIQIALVNFTFVKGTIYVASSIDLEKCKCIEEIKRSCFGQMEIQVGLCWGDNTKLNGMEYHKSSEVIIAATDLILMLGQRSDITEQGWHSNKTECFYVSEGTVLELYATTLHLAPCRTNHQPFYAIIILPRGTNTPLTEEPSGLLWMKNKWLLSHPEGSAAAKGAAVKILGANLSIKTIKIEENL